MAVNGKENNIITRLSGFVWSRSEKIDKKIHIKSCFPLLLKRTNFTLVRRAKKGQSFLWKRSRHCVFSKVVHSLIVWGGIIFVSVKTVNLGTDKVK